MVYRFLSANRPRGEQNKGPLTSARPIMLLRTINTAALTYESTYDHGYPASLAAMGPPKPGMKESHEAAGFITETEASGTHFGYRFTYVAGEKQHGRVQTYTVHADPLKAGEKGRKHFFTDQSGVIRERTKKRMR